MCGGQEPGSAPAEATETLAKNFGQAGPQDAPMLARLSPEHLGQGNGDGAAAAAEQPHTVWATPGGGHAAAAVLLAT
eukprot:1988373-Prorocentrum_lima.AAC.1